MPEGRQGREGSLEAVRQLVRAALEALEASRGRIDDLNVYPVPDGDTGTNMTLTVRAIRDALESSNVESRAEIAREATRAALMGARGNSGVILSQVVRGAADALAGDATAGSAALAAALRAGSDAAYASLRNPQEGTILTVARALAESAEEAARRELALPDTLAQVVAAGEEALARTPEQLPILAEAGVVDAGGAALLELVRGLAAQVRGEPLPRAPSDTAALPLEAVHVERSRYRYCTSFYVEGEEAAPDELERALCEFGDSVLVVGTRGAVKVHVHTDEPGRALSLATALGVVEEVDVKNMHAQTAEREQRLSARAEPARSAVVAVVAGAGNEELFRSLGAARIVPGGQSMNPSTSEILTAIDAAPGDAVLVLPNNPNVVAAAEQAAAASEKRVEVVPTRSLQAGLAAMVAFGAERDPDENVREMDAAARLVRTGAVACASRSTVAGGVSIHAGEFVGLVEGEPVATGTEVETVARAVVERLLVEPSDVLTVLTGAGAPDVNGLRHALEATHPELEIEIHDGGQPHYALLFSAE